MPIEDYHAQFASYYDAFYGKRDFLADARYSADLLGLDRQDRYGGHILDFGCGSGSHVLAFSRLGIDATGFDRSTMMIEQATAKPVPENGGKVCFVPGEFADFCAQQNGQLFDGAVSIFQVFNCMDSAGEMLGQLKLIRSRLGRGARFLLDLWNGAAVFADDPHPEVRQFRHPEDESLEIIRITTPKLDRVNQQCTLHYRVLIISRGTRATFTEFESLHKLTYLTPVQYRHLFELADLKILDEFRRGHPGTPITDRDWYISYLVCC